MQRLVEENDELRTVLQNHNIIVRPPPLSFDRRTHGRKNNVPVRLLQAIIMCTHIQRCTPTVWKPLLRAVKVL